MAYVNTVPSYGTGVPTVSALGNSIWAGSPAVGGYTYPAVGGFTHQFPTTAWPGTTGWTGAHVTHALPQTYTAAPVTTTPYVTAPTTTFAAGPTLAASYGGWNYGTSYPGVATTVGAYPTTHFGTTLPATTYGTTVSAFPATTYGTTLPATTYGTTLPATTLAAPTFTTGAYAAPTFTTGAYPSITTGTIGTTLPTTTLGAYPATTYGTTVGAYPATTVGTLPTTFGTNYIGGGVVGGTRVVGGTTLGGVSAYPGAITTGVSAPVTTFGGVYGAQPAFGGQVVSGLPAGLASPARVTGW